MNTLGQKKDWPLMNFYIYKLSLREEKKLINKLLAVKKLLQIVTY